MNRIQAIFFFVFRIYLLNVDRQIIVKSTCNTTKVLLYLSNLCHFSIRGENIFFHAGNENGGAPLFTQ